MDETHLPPEAGLDRDAISQQQGLLHRDRKPSRAFEPYGQVTGGSCADSNSLTMVPASDEGGQVDANGREVGSITSARESAFSGPIRAGLCAEGIQCAGD